MPGKDSFVYRTLRPWPNKRLKKAAIVGHTTTTATRLWFRTGDNGKFTVLIYESTGKTEEPVFMGLKSVPYLLENCPQGSLLKEFEIKEYEKDTTHVEDINRLKPNTLYAYALYSAKENRIILGQDRVFSFRTMSAENEPFSFALYSCHMPYKYTMFKNTKMENEEMWDCFRIALNRHREKDLRFVIGGGDQVYTDGVESLNIWTYLDKVMRKENGEIFPTHEDMVSWYRDIYRGYWGFDSLQNIFSNVPTYMMWDDHELGDGCGSYYLDKDGKKELSSLLPSIENSKTLTYEDGLLLYERMIKAAKQVYHEYQHSHNPDTPKAQYDYGFYIGDHSAFYFLDGRGYRDVQRDSYRIHGKEQFDRFEEWLNCDDTKSRKFVFVLAAVPVFHIRSVLANNVVVDNVTLEQSDDLRDSWEHNIHEQERLAFTDLLFQAAGRGQKISILSGDVHVSAAFKLTNDKGHVLYQLTSSAITYNTPLITGWLFGNFGTLPEEGETKEGYKFERMALYLDSNFSIIKVNPNSGKATFQLYGKQSIQPPNKTLLKKNQPYAGMADIPITHSIARVDLNFT
ncbi:MAG: alkaline phosphatase family protein [Candidatus Scalindua sp.]|jgi:alkaline phosphatase D|nr:alkaline phosphatase family protein [Candidatus Scalindua sp.]MBT6049681.1 alkaline phosphatase family protein [Candidatus Scalindua sp.]